MFKAVRGRHRSRGQSLVEFALILPVVLLIMLIAFDFGRVFLGWVNLNNMARIGANFAALNPDAWQGAGDATIMAKYQELMPTMPAPTAACSQAPSGAGASRAPPRDTYKLGSPAQVTITCQFALLTPLVGNDRRQPDQRVSATSAVFPSGRERSLNIPVGRSLPTPTPTPTPSQPRRRPRRRRPIPSASASATPIPIDYTAYVLRHAQ